MATGGSGSHSNAGRIVARLRTWPGVSVVRADCGVGVALCAGGRQIMHLHGGDEAELCLTRPVVDRLGGALADSGRALVRPGGDWVAVRLDTDSDLAMVMSLASVAIKAALNRPVGAGARIAPCAAARPHRVGGSAESPGHRGAGAGASERAGRRS
ncbi:luciferase family protein [Actinomadura rubrisoli]|uniref:Luciferase domain-containing protein n=1 Tax=Actinomadura rubrisoli TaxID=2530368 RepID=A0A4R5C8I5_9ACTN|nr:luciferase family protein [Actinomadura rubrisoli]TDD96098.1 hypothetical protein E1298_03925 [Actinomadura rubrisoli]